MAAISSPPSSAASPEPYTASARPATPVILILLVLALAAAVGYFAFGNGAVPASDAIQVETPAADGRAAATAGAR